jgi:protein involved in polysaccharide export with SLBB domain
VVNPGRYPYIPDRNWEYYIALAGGFRKEQNTSKKVTIWGAAGQKMNKNSIIIPETVINAETNGFLYHFNQTAPVVTTLVGLILSFLSVQALLARERPFFIPPILNPPAELLARQEGFFILRRLFALPPLHPPNQSRD